MATMYGAAYKAGHDRVVAFLADRDTETVVPACPDWTAADVVRSSREQRFWPRNPEPPAFSEEFAAICQDGLTRPTDEADNDFEPGA